MHLDIDIMHNIVPYDCKLADKVISKVITILLQDLPTPTMVVHSGRGLTWIYQYSSLIENPTIQIKKGKKNYIFYENTEVITHDVVFKKFIK